MNDFNYEILIENSLGIEAHWQVNKKMAKEVGIEPALMLADLISKYKYFKKNHLIGEENEGWFFNTRQNVEDDTNLTPYQQRKAVDKLVSLNLIQTKKAGIPPKTFYRINYNEIGRVLGNAPNIKKLEIRG